MTDDTLMTAEPAEAISISDALLAAWTVGYHDRDEEIDKLRGLLRQVVRSSWPPPPSWYAEAIEALGDVSNV